MGPMPTAGHNGWICILHLLNHVKRFLPLRRRWAARCRGAAPLACSLDPTIGRYIGGVLSGSADTLGAEVGLVAAFIGVHGLKLAAAQQSPSGVRTRRENGTYKCR